MLTLAVNADIRSAGVTVTTINGRTRAGTIATLVCGGTGVPIITRPWSRFELTPGEGLTMIYRAWIGVVTLQLGRSANACPYFTVIAQIARVTIVTKTL